MNKTGNKKLIPIVAIAAAAVILIGAVVFVLTQYAFVEGHFYSRKQYVYDLRDQDLSEETYKKLAAKLPDSWIIWNAPFQGGTKTTDISELTVTSLSDEDVNQLDCFKKLKTVHGEDCTDWEQLAELQRRHPDCEVLYNVVIGGETYPQNAEHAILTKLTDRDVALLECLPNLKGVDATGCCNYLQLDQLKENHPEWNLTYAVTVGSKVFDRNATLMEAEGGSYDQLAGAFEAMPKLNKVMITNPDATGKELQQLREAYPDLNFHWQVDAFGTMVPDDAAELDLSGNTVTVKQAKQMAALFPKLEKLIMSDCGVKDAEMAEFREEMRDQYKVVWTVYFTSKCKARTDDTIFMPIKQGEYYFNDSHTKNLKYLEDMICMDIGHAPVKHLDFLEYMPKLKYLILAWSDVRDITPISNCKELIFLELDNSPAPDFTPLLELKNLQDLNVGGTYADWRPLAEMTWLKNLWICERPSGVMRATLTEALPNTHIEMDASYTVGNGWRKLQNYYDMRDMLGMYYMD